MSGFRLVGFVLALALPLWAQEHKLSEHQLGAYQGSDDAVRSAMSYCDAVDDSAREQQPRIFAQLNLASTSRSTNHHWTEVASKDEWEASGKPAPLTFVWSKDGTIVRVTVIASPSRFRTPVVAHRRVDYCYGADTKLLRVRAAWYVPTSCEFLFPCRLIGGHEFPLRGQTPAVTDWVFTEDGTITKLRNGKAIDDYFDPSNSLSASDLHLRKSNDLPFNYLAPK
jgi:hypothetical protein